MLMYTYRAINNMAYSKPELHTHVSKFALNRYGKRLVKMVAVYYSITDEHINRIRTLL